MSALRVRAVRDVLESEYCRHSTVGAKDLRAADVWLLKSSGACPAKEPPSIVELKLLLPPLSNPANAARAPDPTAPSIPPEVGLRPLLLPMKPADPPR